MKKLCSKLIPPRLAVLVLLWDILIYSQSVLLRYSATTYLMIDSDESLKTRSAVIYDICYALFFLIYPLCGLLADVWIGRYKAITIGIIACFLSYALSSIGYVMYYLVPGIKSSLIYWIIFLLIYFFEIIGYTSFRANIMQYNIDQYVGASSDQLSHIIYWHVFIGPCTFGALQIGRCLISNIRILLPLAFIISGVAVSLTLVTHSLCKHQLEVVSLIDNPIKLIIRVLNYARKHKYPENRSALTYWEEESPSRIDLGKEKYGGPFTEEEVENVKTVLNIIPLLISVVGLGITDEVFWKSMCCYVPITSSIVDCLISTAFFRQLTTASLIPFYILLNLFCYKCMCSMLKKIGIGLAFAMFSMIAFVIVIHLNISNNTTYYFNKALLVPQVLFGIAYFLLYSTSLEFTIAQTPAQFRGTMVGLWFAALGIGYMLSINLKYLFPCIGKNDYICADYHYYLTKSCIVLFILIVFVFLAMRYKLRVRENEVNIHKIVEDYYQKYFELKNSFNFLKRV